MKLSRNVKALLMTTILCFALFPAATLAAQVSEPEISVVEMSNTQRANSSIPALTIDRDLSDAADIRAAELEQVFSHDRPDGSSWSTVSSRVNGENIAYGYASATAVVEGWMNSQGHRDNILNASYRSVGVGCYVNNGQTYWVMLLGNGESLNPVSAVTTPPDLVATNTTPPNTATINSEPLEGDNSADLQESAMSEDEVELNKQLKPDADRDTTTPKENVAVSDNPQPVTQIAPIEQEPADEESRNMNAIGFLLIILCGAAILGFVIFKLVRRILDRE